MGIMWLIEFMEFPASRTKYSGNVLPALVSSSTTQSSAFMMMVASQELSFAMSGSKTRYPSRTWAAAKGFYNQEIS